MLLTRAPGVYVVVLAAHSRQLRPPQSTLNAFDKNIINVMNGDDDCVWAACDSTDGEARGPGPMA